MKTHQNGAVPDLRRAVGRRLCITLAAQSVYAMELYLFFFRPDMVWNKMLVMLECIFLLPCLRALFFKVLAPVTALAGKGFGKVCAAVICLLGLTALCIIWRAPVSHVDRFIFALMLILESFLLFLIVITLRAWTIIRREK